jgi:hypothetical protein
MLTTAQVTFCHNSIPPSTSTHRRHEHINIVPTAYHITFLHDHLCSQRSIIGTSASKSVIPHCSSLPPTGPAFSTTDDQPIATWGYKRIPLQFCNCRFHFHYIMANISTPIIDHEFLQAHQLLVDPAHHHLLDGLSLHLQPIAADSSPPPMATSFSYFSLPSPPLAATSTQKYQCCGAASFLCGSGSG